MNCRSDLFELFSKEILMKFGRGMSDTFNTGEIDIASEMTHFLLLLYWKKECERLGTKSLGGSAPPLFKQMFISHESTSLQSSYKTYLLTFSFFFLKRFLLFPKPTTLRRLFILFAANIRFTYLLSRSVLTYFFEAYLLTFLKRLQKNCKALTFEGQKKKQVENGKESISNNFCR